MTTQQQPLVLVIDDDPSFHDIVSYNLRGNDYQMRYAPSPNEVIARETEARPPAVILLDWRLESLDGIDFIEPLRRKHPISQIIFVTGHVVPEVAAESIRLGAFGFINKPLEKSRLLSLVQAAVQQYQMSCRLQSADDVDASFEGIVGASPQMQTVYHSIRNVAPTNVSVMISGESGTGKELVAAAIHRRSDRHAGAFVALNMASIPDELAESTLFGHEKGAFTGAERNRDGAVREAKQGTLFLDEITEMPLALQGKLLRFLQENVYRPVGADRECVSDTRIICATNRDPVQAIRENRLREDLYYRLCVVPIELPPLREREGDVALLVEHAIRQLAKVYGRGFESVDSRALMSLTQYHWPGNVRQLLHLLERVVIMNDGCTLEKHMLPTEVLNPPPGVDRLSTSTSPDRPHSLSSLRFRSRDEIVSLQKLEEQALKSALTLCNGSAYEAARRLNISTATIYRKIKLYGLNDHS